MLFLFWKLLLFLRYLNFCPDFLGQVEKQLDKKAEVNLKFYDINLLQYTYYPISREVKVSENEIWSNITWENFFLNY